MKKRIAILGSTGSIGTQSLDVLKLNENDYEVYALLAYSNSDLLSKQINIYRPKYAGIINPNKKIEENPNTKIFYGKDCIKNICSIPDIDTVIIAVVGIAGLPAVIECIKNKKNIALANKEALVAGGQIVMQMIRDNKINLAPVDSEHSAIFQCMQGVKDKSDISKLILTASGGPFRTFSKEQMKSVKAEDALNHPTWKMGKRITIDSASLMNKGFEIIEAKWLFDFNVHDIDIVIHSQSVIHSMIQLRDNSIIAQLGVPDMRIPILYALSYPGRKISNVKPLNFAEVRKLTFEAPDYDRFPCLKLAYQALENGGTSTAVLNAADETAVSLFLDHKIGFLDIHKIIEKSLNEIKSIDNPDLDDIFYIDRFTREFVFRKYNS